MMNQQCWHCGSWHHNTADHVRAVEERKEVDELIKQSAELTRAEEIRNTTTITEEEYEKERQLQEAYEATKKQMAKSAPKAIDKQEGGDHYKSMSIQPVQYIHANGIGFCEGNVIKYVTRWRSKGGVEDLRKARHFLDLLIELEADDGGAE